MRSDPTVNLASAGEAMLADHVHLLPCAIQYDGCAKVANYFDPLLQEEGMVAGKVIQSSTFRGRGLVGTQMQLPAGYLGHCLADQKPQDGLEDAAAQWETKSTFTGFTYWNHEAHPQSTDAPQRLMEWLPLASHVHCPIDPEEVQKRLREGSSTAA